MIKVKSYKASKFLSFVKSEAANIIAEKINQQMILLLKIIKKELKTQSAEKRLNLYVINFHVKNKFGTLQLVTGGVLKKLKIVLMQPITV